MFPGPGEGALASREVILQTPNPDHLVSPSLPCSVPSVNSLPTFPYLLWPPLQSPWTAVQFLWTLTRVIRLRRCRMAGWTTWQWTQSLDLRAAESGIGQLQVKGAFQVCVGNPAPITPGCSFPSHSHQAWRSRTAEKPSRWQKRVVFVLVDTWIGSKEVTMGRS